MDEQRIQAYVELIQVLLSCQKDQESTVLQQHRDLLDDGLLQVMNQVAGMLRQQGQAKPAHSLEQMVSQLDQMMGDENTRFSEPTMPENLQTILQTLSQPSDLQGMERRVVLCQQALRLVSRRGNAELWASLKAELGDSSYQNPQGDRAENIENAIAAYEQALQVMTREVMPVEWATSMMSLANAYSERIRGDRAENIENAIAVYEKALQVTAREAMPAQWAASMGNLANAYSKRIRGDRAENIENAIATYEQVLQVTTREAMPIEWATSMSNLASAYSERIRGDRAENIENAIAAYEQALQVTTREAMPIRWATLTTNLATAYSKRIYGDRAKNIEKTLEACQQALQVTTYEAMPIKWAQSMSSLANAYYSRIQGDRAENIENAIMAYEQSLQMTTRKAMPIKWAQSMNNLAIAYSERIRGDRAENIENAIVAYEQALQIRSRKAMPIKWAQSMNNLAIAYSERIRGDRAENIEDAIAACQQSLQVTTREAMPIEWAATMNNLATAYFERIRGDRAENIENAIAAYEQALQVTTREAMPIEWATAMNNLANAYSGRIQGIHSENIEEAIAAYEQALQVTTREAMPIEWAQSMSNLAMAYSRRPHEGAQNIENAIKTSSQALEIFTTDTHPNDCRFTARFLASLYADENRWDEAKIPYETALIAGEILYQAALSKGSQETELAETNDLYRRAAYAYAKVGELTTAIATLEQGRARGLSETLQRDRIDLAAIRQINPDLAEHYQTAANAINQLESTERRITTDRKSPNYSEKDFRQQAIQSRQALKDCLTEIRQISGYENFLALPTFEDVAETIQPDYPLIYILSTPNGSLALIFTTAGVTDLWLNDLTEPQLKDTLENDWFKTYRESQTNRQAWFEVIDNVTHQFWNGMMAPLISHLQQNNLSKAILIPTGYLSYLPLHAAWTPDTSKPNGRRYACDDIQFIYAPNALSLDAARSVANRTSSTTLLAINEPSPVNAGNLPSASAESAKAISAFGKGNWELLQQKNATRTAVLEQLPQKNVVHFSCHGFADLGTPLNSGLLMANNEILSLRDLLDLKLQNLRLAILSACETGIPGAELPDEVISLPTGLLQAGAAGVVSSLWSVADLSTMVLLSRFYELWRTEAMEPPEALHQAQIWLRDSDGPALAPYLASSHPDLAQKLAQEPDQRPFAHPFYWAAFTYVGV